MVRVVMQKLDAALERERRDSVEIFEYANSIDALCDALYDWECDVYRTLFPEEYAELNPRMQGWTAGFFEQIERLPVEMAKPLADPSASGTCHIQLFFSVPPGVEDSVRDLAERINNSS